MNPNFIYLFVTTTIKANTLLFLVTQSLPVSISCMCSSSFNGAEYCSIYQVYQIN